MSKESVLSLLSNLTVFFTVFSVAFLLVSIFLFFYLHIRDTALELSGKTRADETRRMQQNYARTGVLRDTSPSEGLDQTEHPQGQPNSSETSGLFLTGSLPNTQPGAERERRPVEGKEQPTGAQRRNDTFQINKEIISLFTEERIS